jgi:hypothetical protein
MTQTIEKTVLYEIKKFVQNVRFEIFLAEKFHIVVFCMRSSYSLVGGHEACRSQLVS